jgi:hypothetical protein
MAEAFVRLRDDEDEEREVMEDEDEDAEDEDEDAEDEDKGINFSLSLLLLFFSRLSGSASSSLASSFPLFLGFARLSGCTSSSLEIEIGFCAEPKPSAPGYSRFTLTGGGDEDVAARLEEDEDDAADVLFAVVNSFAWGAPQSMIRMLGKMRTKHTNKGATLPTHPAL